jgi:hypothetical protein
MGAGLSDLEADEMRMERGRARGEDRGRAEEIAGKALLHLAEEPRRLAAFLAETGIGPDELRASVGDAATLVAVLDHVLANESELLAFAATAGIRPEAVMKARIALGGAPGGEA